MIGPSYPTDGVTLFHMSPPAYCLYYSWELCVYVCTHDTITPLHNCMVDFKYGIFPYLHNHMVEFKYGIFEI